MPVASDGLYCKPGALSPLRGNVMNYRIFRPLIALALTHVCHPGGSRRARR